MAIIHQATISPTKLELAANWLDRQPWGGGGDAEIIGGYRFDDPAGEVGIEALLVQRGDRVLQVPLAYRGAPISGADEHLITTMEHSALGPRWIYHAAGDPVAVDCFTRALRGELPQAALEIHAADGTVSTAEPAIRVHAEGDASAAGVLGLSQDLAAPVTGTAQLIAEWEGGRAVVAALT